MVKMGFSLILVFCAATFSVAFTKQVLNTQQHDAHSIIHTSFGFRDGHSAGRSDAATIVSSPKKKRRSVNSDPSNLRLAAFNVRTFGTKKMATPGVPDILVKVGMF